MKITIDGILDKLITYILSVEPAHLITLFALYIALRAIEKINKQ